MQRFKQKTEVVQMFPFILTFYSSFSFSYPGAEELSCKALEWLILGYKSCVGGMLFEELGAIILTLKIDGP